MQQHSLMQSHHQLADAGRKQLEQLLHQLQEQLQINLLQQTHMFQQHHNASKENSDMDKNARNEKKGSRSSTPHERSTPNTGRNAPNPAAIQQLQFQQQQLISQLQLVQQ